MDRFKVVLVATLLHLEFLLCHITAVSKANSTSMTMNDDQNAALKVHNDARGSKGLRPLSWDQGLANSAQDWADHLAEIGQMVHSGADGVGENLFGVSPPQADILRRGAQDWIEESVNYHGEKIGEGDLNSFGHYSG